MQLITQEFNDRGIRLKLKDGHTTISECKVSIGGDKIWSITEWFTNTNYQHQGLGNQLLREAFCQLYRRDGMPNEIRYNWNGVNQYVMDWLTKNFDPVSILPLSVQKYSEEDNWEAHIYVLNKNKLLDYYRNLEKVSFDSTEIST